MKPAPGAGIMKRRRLRIWRKSANHRNPDGFLQDFYDSQMYAKFAAYDAS